MVWVSNRASATIDVSITTATTVTGSAAVFPILPQAQALDTPADNLWPRDGQEQLTVTWSDKTVKVIQVVDPDAFVRVYDGAIALSQVVVIRV